MELLLLLHGEQLAWWHDAAATTLAMEDLR
jgi:hypothetical protein